MKIKIAILENDRAYLNRIVSVFNMKYSDKFEVYSFTDQNVAMSTLDGSKVDIFLANDSFDINVADIPKRCGFAYLTDSAGVEEVRGQRTIAKFQKVDLIYKQILSIYSETAGSISGLKLGGDSARIIAFQSVAGGCGASSMSAACAAHFAAQGKRTLHLCLERFGTSDLFFNAEGQFDMSDLIFALKSKKPNFALKLESYVKQDGRGVFFFSGSKLALDMLELTSDDISRLLTELEVIGSYDIIVLDMDFSMSRDALKVLRRVHSIVWVCDGSEIANAKTIRAYEALSILEKDNDAPLTNRISLLYNKFSNKTSKTIDEQIMRSIGGAQKFEFASADVLIKQIASMNFFDKMI